MCKTISLDHGAKGGPKFPPLIERTVIPGGKKSPLDRSHCCRMYKTFCLALTAPGVNKNPPPVKISGMPSGGIKLQPLIEATAVEYARQSASTVVPKGGTKFPPLVEGTSTYELRGLECDPTTTAPSTGT